MFISMVGSFSVLSGGFLIFSQPFGCSKLDLLHVRCRHKSPCLLGRSGYLGDLSTSGGYW